jgi:radical SAM superfamily enzyme YgiQ (UPF0313 family)
MHILLIQALAPRPFSTSGKKYIDIEPTLKIFPLGLSLIGTYLENNHHSVEIFDMNIYDKPFSKLKKRLEKKDYDVVGVSLRNIFVRDVKPSLLMDIFTKTIEMIKNYNVKVIAGGSGFTLFAKELMEKIPQIDFGVIGEGEETFLDLLKNLDNPKKVRGICYRKGKRVIFTKKREPLKNLDFIPRRDLSGLPKNLKVYDQVGVETRRGCEFRCIYCGSPIIQGNFVRFRQPKIVLEEIECLRNNFGIKNLFFADCIFYPSSHIEKICDLLIKSKVDVNWSAYFREDSISKMLVEKIIKAGCSDLQFSPDSGSEIILRILQKKLTPKQILKAARIIRNFKEVNTRFYMFLNAPGETICTLMETFRLVRKLCKLKLKGCVSFNQIQIFPRTRIYKIALRNRIIDKNSNLLQPKHYNPLPLSLFLKPLTFKKSVHLFSINLETSSLCD